MGKKNIWVIVTGVVIGVAAILLTRAGKPRQHGLLHRVLHSRHVRRAEAAHGVGRSVCTSGDHSA